MARRMGKTADDQYMGGGSGNWSRAPKKKKPAAKKKAPNRVTAEKVKKMNQMESSAPKPRVKPNPKPSKTSGPQPSETHKARVRKFRESPAAKSTGSIYPKTSDAYSNSPVVRMSKARGGTYSAAGNTRKTLRRLRREKMAANSRSITVNGSSKKPQSRSMGLGQGRSSPAAKKLKRTVGYGR